MYVIPGNHDLKNHSLDLLDKTGLNTLEEAGSIEILKTELETIYSYKVEVIKDITEPYGEKEVIGKVGLIHKLIGHSQSDTSAKDILKKHPEFDLIVSGDNHQSFVEEYKGRILVNPGSLTRQSASHQDDHTPCVYLWYAEDNTVEKVEIPHDKNVISREHLESKEKNDERMEAFVKRLTDDYEINLSFENNLTQYFENNRTRKAVKEMVYEFIG